MRKHSLQIAGHRTSVSLEDAFWAALRDIEFFAFADAGGLVCQRHSYPFYL